MKKAKNTPQLSENKLLNRQSRAGYGAQDFKQGRAGMQSGQQNEEKLFSQFHNAGHGGFASQQSANSTALQRSKRSK